MQDDGKITNMDLSHLLGEMHFEHRMLSTKQK
jgi:hypothetical protein